MNSMLYVGFKGNNNSSARLVQALSGQSCLLTNSFAGLKRDIDKLSADYDAVYLFGADKNLTDSFRIEACADKEGTRLSTALNLTALSNRLSDAGINSTVSETPTHYL